MDVWAELVELYEYKVADLLAGRQPRGGKHAMTDLRQMLLGADLEPALVRRFTVADKQFREIRAASSKPESQQPTTWSPPSTAHSGEAAAWLELRTLAWLAQLDAELRRALTGWSRVNGQPMLRALYAVIENTERALAGNPVLFSVPSLHDPLVSFQDPQVVMQLAESLRALLLTPAGRKQLLLSLSAVHDQPFVPHPDDGVLAAQIEAAEREPVTPEERQALIRSLLAKYPQAHDPRERPTLRRATLNLQGWVEDFLDEAPQSLDGVVPRQAIVYARDPRAARATPDDGASEVLLHLGGERREATWRGMYLRWLPVKQHWQLHIDHQITLLRTDSPPLERQAVVEHPSSKLRLFVSGAYAMVQLAEDPAQIMQRLGAEAKAAVALHQPGGDYANLRLARAAAHLFRTGQLEGSHLQADTQKYAQAPAEALQAFVRKGVHALVTHLQQQSPADAQAGFDRSARALGLAAAQAEALLYLMRQAAFPAQTPPLPEPTSLHRGQAWIIPADGRFHSVQLDRSPVTVQLDALPEVHLMLQPTSQGGWEVVRAGYPGSALNDLLLLPLGELTLALVRHGHWIAATALPSR